MWKITLAGSTTGFVDPWTEETSIFALASGWSIGLLGFEDPFGRSNGELRSIEWVDYATSFKFIHFLLSYCKPLVFISFVVH